MRTAPLLEAASGHRALRSGAAGPGGGKLVAAAELSGFFGSLYWTKGAGTLLRAVHGTREVVHERRRAQRLHTVEGGCAPPPVWCTADQHIAAGPGAVGSPAFPLAVGWQIWPRHRAGSMIGKLLGASRGSFKTQQLQIVEHHQREQRRSAQRAVDPSGACSPPCSRDAHTPHESSCTHSAISQHQHRLQKGSEREGAMQVCVRGHDARRSSCRRRDSNQQYRCSTPSGPLQITRETPRALRQPVRGENGRGSCCTLSCKGPRSLQPAR